jgi:hypothetical protein
MNIKYDLRAGKGADTNDILNLCVGALGGGCCCCSGGSNERILSNDILNFQVTIICYVGEGAASLHRSIQRS